MAIYRSEKEENLALCVIIKPEHCLLLLTLVSVCLSVCLCACVHVKDRLLARQDVLSQLQHKQIPEREKIDE